MREFSSGSVISLSVSVLLFVYLPHKYIFKLFLMGYKLKAEALEAARLSLIMIPLTI